MERIYDTPCASEDAWKEEWAAFPQELRDFVLCRGRKVAAEDDLNAPLVVQVMPDVPFSECGYPVLAFRVASGGTVCREEIDVSLLLRIFKDGGIPEVQQFIISEVSARLWSLSQFIAKSAQAV